MPSNHDPLRHQRRGHGSRAQARLARCLFCKARIAKPRPVALTVYSPEGCTGGICPDCGAAFVMDETGKNGGDALLDGLAMICGGDLEAASRLTSADYQVRDGIYYREQAGPGLHRPYVIPKLWFVHLGPLPEKTPPPPSSGRRRRRRR